MQDVRALRAQAKENSRRVREEELWRAFGAAVGDFRADSNVTDVMLNPDGKVFIDRRRGGLLRTELQIDPDTAQNALYTLAGHHGLPFDRDTPYVECELPGGHRVIGTIPPLREGPTLVVRFHRANEHGPLTYEQVVASRLIPAPFADALQWAAKVRLNVFFYGPTSSAKTTFLGVHMLHIATAFPDERIITVERAFELPRPSQNVVPTREIPSVSSDKIIELNLWERPSRLMWGEAKSGAVATLIYDAWSTGHDGAGGSIHAKTALGALRRVESLIVVGDKPVVRETIGDAVNVLAGMLRCEDGERRMVSLHFVRGFVAGSNSYELVEVPFDKPFEPPAWVSPARRWWEEQGA